MIEKILWDHEIHFRPKDKTHGVYIWFENHHGINKPLYIGMSMQLLKRIYVHCSGSLEQVKGESIVWSYMKTRSNEPFEPCNNYINGCDCIPRFFAKLIIFPGDEYSMEKERLVAEFEKKMIMSIKPLLNRQMYKLDWPKKNVK